MWPLSLESSTLPLSSLTFELLCQVWHSQLSLPQRNTLNLMNSKSCLKQLLSKRPQVDFQDQLSLNAGQKYCRMLQREHSAILLPSLSYQLSLRPLFCLFLSGRFTQVLPYIVDGPTKEQTGEGMNRVVDR